MNHPDKEAFEWALKKLNDLGYCIAERQTGYFDRQIRLKT